MYTFLIRGVCGRWTDQVRWVLLMLNRTEWSTRGLTIGSRNRWRSRLSIAVLDC